MIHFEKKTRELRYLWFFVFISIMTGCSTIDHALYDLSNSVSSVDRVTGERTVNLYNRSAQIKQSDAVVERLIKEKYTDKDLPINEGIDPESYGRVKQIFDRVHAVSHLKDETWNVVLVPEESFNAFVTGGTYVIVHRGLLDEVQSDDEIAYILGHEIAHVSANHVYESQSYNVGAQLAGSKSAKRGSFQAAFTHENEEEADKIGLLYATLAGYNPVEGADTWTRLGEKFGYHASTYSTHPIAKERAANNQKWAELYKEHYLPGRVNPESETILGSSAVLKSREFDNDKAKPGEGGGLEAVMDTVLSVFGTRAKAKTEEARQTNRIEFIKKAQGAMQLVRHERTGENSVRSFVSYRGGVLLRDVVFRGVLGQESTIFAVDGIVQPGATMVLDFTFKNVTVPVHSNRIGLSIALDYAEAG
jgi:predicted Zn-dependent protease